jgi:hypothetical protein
MQPDIVLDFVVPVLAIMALFGGLSLLADVLGRINWNYFADKRRTAIQRALANQYQPEELARIRMLARHMASVNEENW